VIGRRKRIRLRIVDGVRKAQLLAERGPTLDAASREKFLNDLAEDFRATFGIELKATSNELTHHRFDPRFADIVFRHRHRLDGRFQSGSKGFASAAL
jgi:hypothetical protein